MGRTAIVTGAGSGIGQALAMEFARSGMNVVCCGRRIERLKETAEKVVELGGEAFVVRVDVTQKEQIDEMVARTLNHFGQIDVLFNNAGSFQTLGGLWEVDPDSWWHDVEVNLRGSMLCCQAVLPHMMERDEGILINMSGGGAGGPLAGGTGYGCSKAAILRLTDTLASELKRVGSSVLVFAMDPEFNRTAMTEHLAEIPGAETWLPWIREQLDTGHGKKPEDCARTTVELIRRAIPELSGRAFHAGQNVAAIAEDATRIQEQGLMTLRFRAWR